jgi:hypothetical protein
MKIGVLVNDLGYTQQNYFFITNVNQLVSSRSDVDIIAFYESLRKPCLAMNFACMQINEAYGYDGVVLATSLLTADKLIRFPSPKKKLFYVWDLEWLRIQSKQFTTLRAIYGHPELELIARSKEHARLIEECWNRPVAHVVDDFNIESLLLSCQ